MTEERQIIPARYGKALVLERGQDITVINTHGTRSSTLGRSTAKT
jgi:hypothetical protein